MWIIWLSYAEVRWSLAPRQIFSLSVGFRWSYYVLDTFSVVCRAMITTIEIKICDKLRQQLLSWKLLFIFYGLVSVKLHLKRNFQVMIFSSHLFGARCCWSVFLISILIPHFNLKLYPCNYDTPYPGRSFQQWV